MGKAKRSPFVPAARAVSRGDAKPCDWPGCALDGEHRAPKSRSQLREYHWFCKEHIRVYNSRWNYYDGMSEDEIEADRRRDTVWNRPSWPLGDSVEERQASGTRRGPKAGNGPFGIDPDFFDDPLGIFDEEREAAAAATVTVSKSQRAALTVLGLKMPVTADTLKSRYKELVKQHHPDTNGGTKAAEEKFKEIREAYETIRQFLAI